MITIDYLELLKEESRTVIERAVEQRAKAIPMDIPGTSVNLCQVLGKYKIYVPTSEQSLGPFLAMDGHWEMWVTQAVAKRVRPGWHCVDGGAHVGYYTMLMADLVGHKGHVHAFEPGWSLWNCLRHTVAISAFQERVLVLKKALSDCCAEERALYTQGAALGGGSLSEPTTASRNDIAVESVPCVTLDEACPGPVDFIKLDIEGHEPEALAGASRVLREHKPTLLIEWSQGLLGEAPLRHVTPLLAAGYVLSTVDTAGQIVPATTEELLRYGRHETIMLWLAPRT